MKKILLIGLIFITTTAFAENPFAQFDFLIGNWQGVESGIAGDGIGFRSYQYDLGKNFITAKNQSTFPISEKKPKGEVHRDFSIFSYNSNISKIVLREFHVEGFANIYELDTELSNENKFVFITREIENNPGNWKAKVVIEKVSDTEFTEYFKIAMDGENYTPFLKNQWYKVD